MSQVQILPRAPTLATAWAPITGTGLARVELSLCWLRQLRPELLQETRRHLDSSNSSGSDRFPRFCVISLEIEGRGQVRVRGDEVRLETDRFGKVGNRFA